jgi:hypothetical protein
MPHITELRELINAHSLDSSIKLPALLAYYLNQEPKQRRISDTWERKKHPEASALVLLKNRIKKHTDATLLTMSNKEVIDPEWLTQQKWKNHFRPSLTNIKMSNSAILRQPIKEKHALSMIELLHFHAPIKE